VLYVVATDGIAASQWASYSRTTEMVSNLFAVGSPSRPILLALVGGGYTVLMVAFGVGVWASAQGSRAMRLTGGALVAYGLSNVLASFFPLTLGSDASVPMHIVVTNVQLMLMLTAISLGAAAIRGWFRWYSVATLVTSVVAGVVSFASAAQPTLWLGIGERISIGAFLLWVAVLGLALWHASDQPGSRVHHVGDAAR
jgi:general stress protein CsbA